MPELLRGVPHENGGDLCPGGGCLGGEGGLGGAGDQALANGPLHGVGGIGGHLVRVGEAGQIAGDLDGIGILKVGEPIEEGGQLLPGQGMVGEKVVSEVPAVMSFSEARSLRRCTKCPPAHR